MKKIKSISTKILLFILSTIILITFIPIYVSADETDPLENILGEVYIQNVATGMYMDIEYGEIGGIPSLETGANSVQREYSASDSQKWIIERVEEPSPYAGEIVIRSAYSGKYLGVSYDDTVFLAQYDTIDDFNIWNINPTGDGTYTFTFSFTPTIPDCYTVAVRSPNSSQNAPIYQMVEEDMASDECDEWYIVKKVISVVNYYDNSFSGYNNGALIGYIDDAVSFANAIYAKNFGISIFMDGDARPYTMYTGCQTDANEPCDPLLCGSTCSEHHKNAYRIWENLMTTDLNRELNHIYILWSNRDEGVFCDENHELVNSYARVYRTSEIEGETQQIIQVFNIPYFTTSIPTYYLTREISMKLILSHEIAHCIGMRDVYDDTSGYHNTLDGEMTCLMDAFCEYDALDFYNSVTNGTINLFCPNCKNKLSNYTSNLTILVNQMPET